MRQSCAAMLKPRRLNRHRPFVMPAWPGCAHARLAEQDSWAQKKSALKALKTFSLGDELTRQHHNE